MFLQMQPRMITSRTVVMVLLLWQH